MPSFNFLSLWRKKDPEIDVTTIPSDPSVQTAIGNRVLMELLAERKSNRNWTFVKRLGFVAFFLVGLIFYINFEARNGGISLIPSDKNVGVVRIEGSILSTSLASAEKIVPALKKAFESDSTEAIILAIDSPGGAPVEAERINFVIDDMRAKHPKPVYAVMQNVGASAAYMIALHADKIYAGRYSMVGSIGAVMSGWDVHKALERHDIYQRVYASGELKAMLNPFIPSTPAAEAKAQDIVDLMGERFSKELHEKRGKLLQDDFKYDTGEIWDGEAAKRIGLVDELGTIESVLSQHPNAKLYDFGPGAKNSGIFSTSIQESITAALQSFMTTTFTPGIR